MLSSYITNYGGESVNLQELLLKLHTLYLEKSPVLFVLSIKNFLESVCVCHNLSLFSGPADGSAVTLSKTSCKISKSKKKRI